MKDIVTYLENTFGFTVRMDPYQVSLPVYIKETFDLYMCWLNGRRLLLAILKPEQEFTVGRVAKQISFIEQKLEVKTAVVSFTITALDRKRLIEKGVNFIVPGKQLFLPALLMDLQENFNQMPPTSTQLLPSSQLILLYHILYGRQDPIAGISLKSVAEKLGYTPMAVTKAAENLQALGLCTIDDSRKEKKFVFPFTNADLWKRSAPFLVTPVLKTVYVDVSPSPTLPNCNLSALPEYSDMNFPRQAYIAIGRNSYFNLQRQEGLVNENEKEGEYCLEVWKYDPKQLAGGKAYVDPLSLYLSLKHSKDERTQLALENILNNFIWLEE
ncbi:MAG: hypothetical protein ACTHMC_24360 [Pseudobacter sp.]|uniref:hypothetical protein n=1 Tax=Pseudobacter sp. TaxID=2045420 RepID=UPI003F7F0CAD